MASGVAGRLLHPLPTWLRQALRLLSLVMFAFAVFAVCTFVWASGWRRFVNALAETNGWLLIGPALYAVVMWICRPRALWRTNIAARRFSIGRYAISLDPVTRLAVVWAESRKLGQYDARELFGEMARTAGGRAVDPYARACHRSADAIGPRGRRHATRPVRAASQSRIAVEFAGGGAQSQTVFRAPLSSLGDRNAAKALDSTLRQI